MIKNGEVNITLVRTRELQVKFSRVQRAGMAIRRVLLVDGEYSISVKEMREFVNDTPMEKPASDEGWIHLDELHCIVGKYGWSPSNFSERAVYTPEGLDLNLPGLQFAKWQIGHLRDAQVIIDACDQWLELLAEQERDLLDGAIS